MNRIVFLTDLRKLLTFMTEGERENTIRHYEAMLDEAGPEKEEELLNEFGSPTKAAVTIFREYGKDHTALDPRTPDEEQSAPEKPESFVPENIGLSAPDAIEEEAEPEASEDTEQTPAEELPETQEADSELTEVEAPSTGTEENTAEPVPAETAETLEAGEAPAEPEKLAAAEVAAVETEAADAGIPAETESVPEKTIADMAARIAAGIEAESIEAESAEAEESPVETKAEKDEPVFVEVPVPPRTPPATETAYEATELLEYRLPGWAVALIMVLTCWLWIPIIAALCVVVLVVFAIPFGLGAALTAGAAYLAISGIWAFGMVTDALLMFGAAAVMLAFGIVLLWLGIWVLIRLFRLLGKGIGGAYRGIFCRKSGKESAE